MTRFRDEAKTEAERRAADVLEKAAVPPRELDASRWQEVVERAMRPQRQRSLGWAFAASVLVGVLVAYLGRTSKPEPVTSLVVVTTGTRWTRGPTGEFQLESGRLTVPRDTKSVTIQTPDLTVTATRAAFLAEVVDGRSFVRVDEGVVSVRVGDTTRELHAGEAFRWPDVPAALELHVPDEGLCRDAAVRAECLEVEARGDALDAQSALYELGALRAHQGDVEGAVSAWTSSLARFPDGVLQPEVRLALFVELLAAHRIEDAQVVGRDFERCCASDPRVADVRSVLKTLAH